MGFGGLVLGLVVLGFCEVGWGPVGLGGAMGVWCLVSDSFLLLLPGLISG